MVKATNNTIYCYGPNLSNKDPEDIVEIKIGMFHNLSKNTNQRFEAFSRSHGDAAKLFEIESDLTDGDVHDFLRDNMYHFVTFKLGKKVGREMFSFKAKHFPDIENAIRSFLNRL